jgi:amidase
MPSASIATLTAIELQNELQKGDLTSVEIVKSLLGRIAAHNHDGKHLNAFISVCPEDIALTRAQVLDQERKEGKIRGPLHGIPIVIKVNTH